MFERGDIGDGCYWLRHGVLAVYVASASGELRILAILGPGAIVGELAMIDGLPRSASVQAIRDCELTVVRPPSPRCCTSIPSSTSIS